MKRLSFTHSPDTARAIAAWASSRAPDEVGAICDAILTLARSRPDELSDLADGARAVLEAPPEDASGLRLLAGLLELTAQRLRGAAEALRDDRTKATH